MAITKTFTIGLENNASMMPIYGGQYKEVLINSDLITLFERVNKARFYLCIPNESGFIGLVAGIVAYGAGGLSQLVNDANLIAGYFFKKGCKVCFLISAKIYRRKTY